MLVLSRQANEKIVFLNLGVTIEVLHIKHRAVRLGVDAPADIPILRGELAASDMGARAALKERKHQLRGEMNLAVMAAALAQKQLQAGLNQEAETSLAAAIARFEELERMVTREMGSESCSSPRSKKKAVLLVEDNANESALLCNILELSGLEVKTACDGCDALDYLSGARPDAILMDMLMPRCDGPSTVAAIRRDPKLAGVKIFAVSGTSPAEFGVNTGPDGVDDWFRKPLNTNRLLKAMDATSSSSN